MQTVICNTTSGNWTAVFPYIDLETIPLEIKTDSTIGSGDEVWVEFTSDNSYVGEFGIYFSSTPQYYISFCMSYTDFPVSLPSDVEKVWRITLNRNSGIRLLIHCNNVEVLNILMSDNTCYSYSSWSTYWNRNVERIWFHHSDTASDYYRAGQSGTTFHMLRNNVVMCTNILDALNSNKTQTFIRQSSIYHASPYHFAKIRKYNASVE